MTLSFQAPDYFGADITQTHEAGATVPRLSAKTGAASYSIPLAGLPAPLPSLFLKAVNRCHALSSLGRSRKTEPNRRLFAWLQNLVANASRRAGGSMTKLRVLSLFAGIGGIDYGLEKTGGFETVAFCEQARFQKRILNKHWPEVPVYDDVTTFEHSGPVDMVAAGFPCQDVSLAGPGAGLAGERSGLFWHILRTVRMVGRPKLLLENVAALLDRGLGAVLGALAQIGYDAEWHCIPASAVGASQERDRCWIIADAMQERGAGLITSADIGAARQGRKGGQTDLLSVSNAPFESRNSIPQPLLCGMDDRVPHRVDRIESLGNAVDPHIPELIGNAIIESMEAA